MQEGSAAFVLGMAEAAEGLKLDGLTVLLENTVGAGAQIGGKLEELRCIRDLAARECKFAVGYCLDTWSSICCCRLQYRRAATGLASTAGETHRGRRSGMENVHVIHTNDSKQGLGSRVDRHANIGGEQHRRGGLPHWYPAASQAKEEAVHSWRRRWMKRATTVVMSTP